MIRLAALEEFFDQEEDTIHDFIVIVLQDWSMIQADILKSLQERNLTDYRFHTHRMTSIVRMLDAERLQRSILTLKAHLMENPTEDFSDKQEELFAAIQEVIQMLEQRIGGMPAR